MSKIINWTEFLCEMRGWYLHKYSKHIVVVKLSQVSSRKSGPYLRVRVKANKWTRKHYSVVYKQDLMYLGAEQASINPITKNYNSLVNKILTPILMKSDTRLL